MTQFTTGTRVRVVGAGGGLFYSGNKGKLGVVTRTSRAGEIVHVRFDDGIEDYGRPVDLEVVTLLSAATGIVVGSQVRVKRAVVFLGKYEGETGEVYHVDGRTIYVQFDAGRDYGLIDELELVNAKDKDGFISNVGNTSGKLPAPRGTKLDVLYNDGTLILDIAIGDGTSKTSVNFPQRSYSATTWAFHGTGSATIKAYRFPADRPGAVASLDEQLAALRAEMDAANTEKRQAQAALTTARQVYDAAEAKRVAVEARLTKHGLRLI